MTSKIKKQFDEIEARYYASILQLNNRLLWDLCCEFGERMPNRTLEIMHGHGITLLDIDDKYWAYDNYTTNPYLGKTAFLSYFCEALREIDDNNKYGIYANDIIFRGSFPREVNWALFQATLDSWQKQIILDKNVVCSKLDTPREFDVYRIENEANYFDIVTRAGNSHKIGDRVG